MNDDYHRWLSANKFSLLNNQLGCVQFWKREQHISFRLGSPIYCRLILFITIMQRILILETSSGIFFSFYSNVSIYLITDYRNENIFDGFKADNLLSHCKITYFFVGELFQSLYGLSNHLNSFLLELIASIFAPTPKLCYSS